MGYEYRLHVDPPLKDTEEACACAFANGKWKQIPTCLQDMKSSIGVQLGESPADPAWPQIADFCLEPDGHIYFLCHNNEGGIFMHAFVDNLKKSGRAVSIDDDI